ncbi:MAG TPA: isocitrate lyase/PEP mutase family protein [Nitrososphaeraceae archaeon]|nr:isocitrate lyase/PEP mutase family protein [Nitrososphaeraceae archaeon]
MSRKRKKSHSLRSLLDNKKEFLTLPGVFDALSARIAEKIGYPAIFQTGYGSAAALLGMPDFGLLNAGETIDNARRIIKSVSIPVIVDIDTGYGNPLNVRRMVQDLEDIGAGGVFLEDQVWPKRCGHMTGKDVIPTKEYISKLRAATDARRSKEFVIVARTDARATLGLSEAIQRGIEYYRSGADVIFVEAPLTLKELREVPSKIDAPLVANMIEQGITPNLSSHELKKMGYKIAVFPLSGLYSATFALRYVFTELMQTGSTKRSQRRMVTFDDFNRLVGLSEYMSLAKEYA